MQQQQFHTLSRFGKLMVFLGVLLLAGYIGNAQIAVSVPDTTLSEAIQRLTLKITGILPAADSVRLYFTYNSSRLSINRINAGTGFLLSCPTPEFSTINGESTGTLQVSCRGVSGGTGIVCEIEAEILRGIDSVAVISPDSVIINGKQEQFTGKAGFVRPTAPPVKVVLIEGLEQSYPNPFYLNSYFFYTVENDTPVHFRIYTVKGQLVRDFDIFPQMRGRHRFYVDALPGEFAAGSYYLSMTTNSGSYVAHLLCLK